MLTRSASPSIMEGLNAVTDGIVACCWMTLNIPLNKTGVVLDGRPGWDLWPVCLSTSVVFCVNNPSSTLHGNFWG